MTNALYAAQNDLADTGYLQIQTLSAENQRPIEGARISVSYTGEPDEVVDEVEFLQEV